MKFWLLISILLSGATSLIGGEWVPLQQYPHFSPELVPDNGKIPDRYLFATAGLLIAMEYPCRTDAELVEKFGLLDEAEQYHVVYVLSKLKDDLRVRSLISTFDTLRRRMKGKNFEDTFDDKNNFLWKTFVASWENSPRKRAAFYDYACKVVRCCDPAAPVNGQMYVVSMLSLAGLKMIQAAPESEKSVVRFVVDTVNKLTSNDARTKLTFDFIRYMDAEQVEGLKTTEYALFFSLPRVLHCGKFLDFCGIYHELVQGKSDSELKDAIDMDSILLPYFSGEKWKTPKEAVEFVYGNKALFTFDARKRKYVRTNTGRRD